MEVEGYGIILSTYTGIIKPHDYRNSGKIKSCLMKIMPSTPVALSRAPTSPTRLSGRPNSQSAHPSRRTPNPAPAGHDPARHSRSRRTELRLAWARSHPRGAEIMLFYATNIEASRATRLSHAVSQLFHAPTHQSSASTLLIIPESSLFKVETLLFQPE